MLANQIRPITLSAAFVFRYTRFWPNNHRELLFLAIVLNITKYPQMTLPIFLLLVSSFSSCSPLSATINKTFHPTDAAAVWLAEDDGVPRCAPLPEPQFGALREGGGTREAGSTVAESLVVLYYRVGTHQIRRRRRAARSLTSQGRAEPLCARITGLNREVSEGKADL